MPELGPVNGHSTDMTDAGWYFTYKKDKNGKRCPEAGVRAVAFDGINIAERSIRDPSKHWWDVMNETREAYGNNAPHGEEDARTYQHYFISPDPRDHVELEEFRQYVREWANYFFNSDLMGSYQVAILYHDGSEEREKKGLPPILHAHVIINNTELKTGRRLAPKINKKISNMMYDKVNTLALDRGWHGFTTDGVSMTLDEMKAVGAKPSSDERGQRAYNREDFIAAGYYLGKDEIGNDISLNLASQYEGVKMTPGPVARYTLEFASGAVYKIIPVGDQKIQDASGGAAKNKSVNPTMAERGVKSRGAYSWKYDIRGRIDAALVATTSVDDFIAFMDRLDIDVVENKAGQFKFCMRGEDNKAKTVLGKTLGKRYERAAIESELEKNAAVQQNTPRTDALAYPRAGFAERLIDAIEGNPKAISPNRAFDEFHELMEYNIAHDIHAYEDYPDDLTGHAHALRAYVIGLFEGAPMPETSARSIEEMTTSERAALVAKLRADRAGAARGDDGRTSPAPGYGTHTGREDAPAPERSQTQYREH